MFSFCNKSHRPADDTRMHLLMFNHSKGDLMLADALMVIARMDPNLQLRFYVSKDSNDESAEQQQDSEEFQPELIQRSMRSMTPEVLTAIAAELAGKSNEILTSVDETMCIICGPRGFTETAKKTASDVYGENVLVW